jgi:preprotein translocase subunit SecE
MDTKNAQFLDLIHPEWCFIKYEYWPNYKRTQNDIKPINFNFKKTKLFLNGTAFIEKHSMLYLLFVQNESSKFTFTLGKQMLQYLVIVLIVWLPF